MSDLISRQTAIDSTWKALFEYEDKMEESYQDPEDLSEWIMKKRPWVQKGHDLCLKALLEEPSAYRPRWIPVSEKLPIPPTYCLVTTDGSNGDVIDIALYMSNGWHKASEVLAWMPLPEPYRKDEESEV